MERNQILWVDDEIDVLKAHILFLEDKGYQVLTATNGEKAIEQLDNQPVNLILLDENMPGLSGMETLNRIKDKHPDVPVIMITKNEEEDFMDEAIGSKIDDYLIKPVNPNQILLAIKKTLDNQRLVHQKATTDYQMEFSKIGMQINESLEFNDWVDVYKKLVYWELELANASGEDMKEILETQKEEANNEFSRYIKNNYVDWFGSKSDKKPLLSPNLFKERIFPLLDEGHQVFVILLDNLRYDQWKTISSMLTQYLTLESEEIYCSILPTTTQYSRNSIFAGLMPYEIEQLNPDLWRFEDEDERMNQYEKDLLENQINRSGKNYKFNYHKIYNKKGEKYIYKQLSNLLNYQFNVIVYNFIDILSHARTNVEMIQELAENESAYRTLTSSWLQHSYLITLIKELAENNNLKVIITTDHGSIKVQNPLKIAGSRETTSNLRYKLFKKLSYDPKQVMEVKKADEAHLPERSKNYSYVFATRNDYFVYQNNYHQYVNYYKNTFQHGGISMEEMLIPFAVLNTKS